MGKPSKFKPESNQLVFFFFAIRLLHFLADFVFVYQWWRSVGHDCACHGTRGDDARTGLTPASAKLLIHIIS